MYRCAVCGATSPPGARRRVHQVKRANGQIAHELPVCAGCAGQLERGRTLAQLQARARAGVGATVSRVVASVGAAAPVPHGTPFGSRRPSSNNG